MICLNSDEQIQHIIHDNGVQAWSRNGQLHRVDGPAYISADGSQWWYHNGQLHRVDGPAYINVDGHQEWYKHDKRHRVDGPAYIGSDGRQEWYVNGIHVTDRIKELIDNSSINSDYNQWTDVEKILVQLAIR